MGLSLKKRQHQTEAELEQELVELAVELDTAESVTEALEILFERLDLSRAALAKSMGVSQEAVRGWLRGAVPQGAHYDRLGELRSVVIELAESRRRTVAGIGFWLTSDDRHLDTSPLNAIGQGRIDEVRARLRSGYQPSRSRSGERAVATAARL